MNMRRADRDGLPKVERDVRPKHLPLIGTAIPPVIPARMLNEVMYCERLMYLEWVHGEFRDNYYTVDGRAAHDRADSPGGSLPEPPSSDDETDEDLPDKPYQARSVWLTSESLGITAKIDIVEGQGGGHVVPIEYKRGKPPNVPERAYLPERVQLCAQVLLLREHGYACEHGEIYFAGSKQRIAIDIGLDLIAHTRWAVGVAQEVASRSEPPKPLDNSPKCRGCSLVGICLPDEVNLLRRLDGQDIVEPPDLDSDLEGPLEPDRWGLASGAPETAAQPVVRQLHPARDDRVPLYVQEHGAEIGLSGECLVVRRQLDSARVRLMNTAQVVVRGNVQVSTQAIRALMNRGIPLVYLSSGGWFSGRLYGNDTNNIDLRTAQYQAACDPAQCIEFARAFVAAKIRNARTMLRRNHEHPDPVVLGQLKQLTRKARACDSIDSLLGIEGAAARVYFQNFAGMFRSGVELGTFDFERRNRRPPRDPVNALLSFAYALLTKDLVIAAAQVGLEPLLGFYHQRRFGRPALALDLMEEFRPLIGDSVVLSVINGRIVGRGDFVSLAGASSLKEHARKRVIEAYERRMDQSVTHPIFGYTISYRRVLEVQARLLSRVLLGELDRYPAFVTR
jgi:CRISPR-associated protein Cas1